MLSHAVVRTKATISVQPEDIIVTMSDEQVLPVSFPLPPISELESIKASGESKISVGEIAATLDENSKRFANEEREKLLRKYSSYKSSSTYLTHLASLSQLAGDMESADRYLQKASGIDSDWLYSHKRTKLATSMGHLAQAFAHASEGDLEKDVTANLLSACIELARGQEEQSKKYLDKALSIDRLDPTAMAFAGFLALRNGAFETAVRYLRSASVEKPSSYSILVNLATAYVCLANRTKAITALRRALAINPLNENAVTFYSDLLFKEGRFEEDIEALERFLQYEQRSVSGWSRLARAYYYLKDYRSALKALKHQGGLEENSALWNNLALVYWKLKHLQRAAQYFGLAVQDSLSGPSIDYVPVINFLGFLSEQKNYSDILRWTESLLEGESGKVFARKQDLSAVWSHHIFALTKLGRGKESVSKAESLLSSGQTAQKLRWNLLLHTTYYYSMLEFVPDKALHHANLILKELKAVERVDPEKKAALYNNVVFVLLECDRLSEAEKLVPNLSAHVHKEPVPTATLGLLHLKRGNLLKGEGFYREAIALASGEFKENLKLKMNLELAKVLLNRGDKAGAKKYLRRAIKRNTGLETFVSEVKKLYKTL